MTPSKLAASCLGAFIMLGVVRLSAQQEILYLQEDETVPAPTTLELIRGTAMLVALPTGVERIAVADESVAQVTILSTEELLIHGLEVGRTTLFAWLTDGDIRRYVIQVSHDLAPLRLALRDVDARIEARLNPDGGAIRLTGDVDDEVAAQTAVARAEQFLASLPEPRPLLINLLHYPSVYRPTVDERLRQALRRIDRRIRVRRIQVGDALAADVDSYILEGQVKTIQDLVRAVTLAERQLGGTGTMVGAADPSRVSTRRAAGLFGGNALGQGGAGLDTLDTEADLTAGLAAQVAKGLVVTSESGRVLSFLQVDRLEQILVSIRVLEIDRVKAKKRGIDYRVDGQDFSVTSLNRGDLINLDSVAGATPIVNRVGTANLVGAYVTGSTTILGAIDFLQEFDVARSVAEPNVMTLTGEQATIVVGGEVPIPTTAANNVVTVQGFFFQSFGVRLDIRPTVGRDGVITMEIAPSIIQPQAGLGVGEVPGFEVQTVETVARVHSGQSLVIGGLLSYEESVSERKVPIAGDIPIISTLFKWRNRGRGEQELLFVITPRIMEQALDGTPGPIELPSMRDINETGLRFQDQPQRLTDEGLPTSWISKEREEWLGDVERRRELQRRDNLHRSIPAAERPGRKSARTRHPSRHHRVLADETPAPPARDATTDAAPLPKPASSPLPPTKLPETFDELPAALATEESIEPTSAQEPSAPQTSPTMPREPGGFEAAIESLLADDPPGWWPESPAPPSAPEAATIEAPADPPTEPSSTPEPPPPTQPTGETSSPAPEAVDPPAAPEPAPTTDIEPTPAAPEAAPSEAPASDRPSPQEMHIGAPAPDDEPLLRAIESIELPTSDSGPRLPRDSIPAIEPSQDPAEDIGRPDELIREYPDAPDPSRWEAPATPKTLEVQE